jgi:hypothetical protein
VRLLIETSSGPERAASDYPRGNAENPSRPRRSNEIHRARRRARSARQRDATLDALHSIEQCRDMRELFSELGNLGRRNVLFSVRSFLSPSDMPDINPRAHEYQEYRRHPRAVRRFDSKYWQDVEAVPAIPTRSSRR